jgi:hypothetical protein
MERWWASSISAVSWVHGRQLTEVRVQDALDLLLWEADDLGADDVQRRRELHLALLSVKLKLY